MTVKKIENMDEEEFLDHIKGLDDEAFMEAWDAYAKDLLVRRERNFVFSQEHKRRVRLQDLQRMGLTAADLELLQSVEPVGIESQESVNGTVNTEPDEVNRG